MEALGGDVAPVLQLPVPKRRDTSESSEPLVGVKPKGQPSNSSNEFSLPSLLQKHYFIIFYHWFLVYPAVSLRLLSFSMPLACFSACLPWLRRRAEEPLLAELADVALLGLGRPAGALAAAEQPQQPQVQPGGESEGDHTRRPEKRDESEMRAKRSHSHGIFK